MSEKEEEHVDGSEKEVDWFRDTNARFLGYANEVGEACRSIMPTALVNATYGVVALYVLADTYDKGTKANKKQFSSVAEKRFTVGEQVFDTLAWQTFASLLVPPLIINRVCKATRWGLDKFMPLATNPKLTPGLRAGATAAVGLGIIPFIVHPCDTFVHFCMNNTTRVWATSLRKKYVTSPDSKEE